LVVHCPKCGARANLGPNADDLSDNRYRAECSMLFAALREDHENTDLECPHMQRVRFDEFVKFRLSAA
jgi:hypothetical protein